MAAVFWHTPDQKAQALETRERIAKKVGMPVHTEVLPASEFTLAEGYHQKHTLRQARTIYREFQALYPRLEDFVDSTAVSRVNGYLGGHGDPGDLERELDGLGLSVEARKRLLALVAMRPRR